MEGYACLLARLELAVPEQRRELDLSQGQLARLARVSCETVSKIERGGQVDPELLLRIASVLTTLELYAMPRKPVVDTVDHLTPMFTFPPPAHPPIWGDAA